MSHLRRLVLVLPPLLGSLALLTAAGARPPQHASESLAEVVVTLPQAPLGLAVEHERTLAARATTGHRLDLRAPASVSYLRTLASAQEALLTRIQASIPAARARWHYSVVVNGMAVVLPRSQLGELDAIPGARVWPSLAYHELLNPTPTLIGAPAVWGPTLATAGQGVKIGILDQGIDQTHVFFDPSGFAYPPGFPKGNSAYTTPKVIVARAFAPPTTTWKYASTPYDPIYSEHATPVAGAAAGDYDTLTSSRVRASGIAPEAYLGNYKVLTVPTTQFGLDGNSPEIVKGIEAAVTDGMDVINLSLGQPEIAPSRDIVAAALDGAAAAGVVSVVAAGNDFDEAGRGSIGSPATASAAIAAAASTDGGDGGPADVIADFSSAGPTPLSLRMKPDVTAPGVDTLVASPGNQWTEESGTSFATPHVAGAAAVLLQRHPGWTVAQVKSALESTGDPVHGASTSTEVSVLREGGGRIDMPRADNPLVFTSPTGLSFGLIRRGTTTNRQLVLTDAGGGPAPWTATIAAQTAPRGVTLAPSAPTAAAGTTLGITLKVAANAASGDATGFVLLTRGSDVRRIPYWAHVEVPQLQLDPHATLTKPGVYGGNTAGKPSRVSTYRYPEGALGAAASLAGPEQVFRVVLKKPTANFGVVVLTRARGVKVSPRLVAAADENRLVGYTALPVDLNPYAQSETGRLVPAVGAVRPTPGSYDFVFDTPAAGKTGRFTFRLWVDDVTPPTIRLLTPSVTSGADIRLAIRDAGSGVDPGSLSAKVDGAGRAIRYRAGVATIASTKLAPGKHELRVLASDYQETKNMENTGPILPNTRVLTTSIDVR